MQSVSSRIWTRVAVSISYDDNDYTTGTSRESDKQYNKEYNTEHAETYVSPKIYRGIKLI